MHLRRCAARPSIGGGTRHDQLGRDAPGRPGPASFVRIARERRLVLEDGHGPQWVDLCWVDEVALALIDLAREHVQSLDLVYPAPAGQVAVLLAAELLLHQFVHGNRESSLGIVTADTTMAARTWNALRIATTGAREPIAEVFPCFRPDRRVRARSVGVGSRA